MTSNVSSTLDWGNTSEWWLTGTGVLSNVTVQRNGSNVQFFNDDGDVVERQIMVPAGTPMSEAYEAVLRPYFCATCGDLLIEGESGMCGACESKAVLDLMKLRRELGG